MRAKLSVLRACRRALRPGGRLAFYTIFIPPGLSEPDYRRAKRSGPSAVTSGQREHRELLDAAGFVQVSETDLTDAFLKTTLAWYRARERRSVQLSEAEGEAAFSERQNDSRGQAEAIESGLLRRALFVAERAGGGEAS